MNRRDFLILAGALGGYSLVVRVDGFGAEPPPRAAIAEGFEPIARVYEVRAYA